MLIVVGFPVFAWYYLSKGTQMRKQAMSNLESKGVLGNFQTTTDTDSVVYDYNLKGKRWIVGIIGADGLRNAYVDQFKLLIQQVSEEFSVNVFTVIGLDAGELIPEMTGKLKLPQDKTWVKTYMAGNHVFTFSQDVFGLPELLIGKPSVVLVDENGDIRNHYNLSDSNELKLTVREIPVFLSLRLK